LAEWITGFLGTRLGSRILVDSPQAQAGLVTAIRLIYHCFPARRPWRSVPRGGHGHAAGEPTLHARRAAGDVPQEMCRKMDGMSEVGAFGRRLGDRFHLDSAPSIVTRTLKKAELAVTEIRGDTTQNAMSESIPREDAFLIALQLRDYPRHQYWEDGRQAPIADLHAGDTTLYDLKRDPVVLLDKPFHSLHFYLPRTALDAIADEAGAPRIGDLHYVPGAGVADETMRHLGLSLHAVLGRPEQVSRMFVDHVNLALAAHVAHAYGGLNPQRRLAKGGLAPWQAKRATEVLSANLGGNVALRALAWECGLSVGHFSRAFRQSMGSSPHQWLLQRRVETAKALLRDRQIPLSEVAVACGFSDQSHFTRVFSRATGMSPGAWRQSAAE